SGSFIFLVLGTYNTVVNAVTALDLKIMTAVAARSGLTILTMVKVIHYFLFNFLTPTLAFIIGSVIGTVFRLCTGWATSLDGWMSSVIVCLLGFGVAFLLGRVEFE